MPSDNLASLDPWLWIALLVVSTLLLKVIHRPRTALQLPPGPRRLPIIGNALDIPRSNVGPSFAKLAKLHGDVMYFDILGQPVITVNSFHHAFRLLDKRAANLSSRPDSVMFRLCVYTPSPSTSTLLIVTGLITSLGLGRYIVFMSYGRKWREHRRAFRSTYGADAISQWQPLQLKTARRLLRRLLESPKDFLAHLDVAIVETSMRVGYGIELTGGEGDREYVDMVVKVKNIVEPLLLPSAYIMEAFPFLRYLPSWLPGMSIKKLALDQQREIELITEKLYTVSTTATEKGTIHESMVTQILAAVGTDDANAREMCHTLTPSAFVGVYADFLARIAVAEQDGVHKAGSETTHATMEAFFLAMAMHPDKQQKAHEELDAVVGPDRLPEFSDLSSLPYVWAILKETLRWHSILPVGLPHAASADEEYEGYHIPAGTIINANLWAMSRDANEYPDPETFVPERFLSAGNRDNAPARDPAGYVFGFGRRICPGRYFAEASLFIYCAPILHVFDIRPPVDERGVPMKMDHRVTDAMISHVEGYEYVIAPRHPHVERLVGDAAGDM